MRIDRWSALAMLALVLLPGRSGGWQTTVDGPALDEGFFIFDEVNAVVADASGDVIAGGMLDQNVFAVLKFDGTTGQELWRKTVPGIGEANAVAVDLFGDVVAVGVVDNNFFVIKLFGASGNEVWSRALDGVQPPGFDVAHAVAIDSAGDVVAAGRLHNDLIRYDFTVVKFKGISEDPGTAGGTELWREEIQGSTSTLCGAFSVVLDGLDNVIAGGCFNPTLPNGGNQFAVVKFQGVDDIVPAGTELWRSTIAGTSVFGPQVARSVALDPTGDVVAAGTLTNTATSFDFAVVKLAEETGIVAWQKELSGDRGLGDEAFDVAVDVNGDVAAVGSFENDGFFLDFAVVRLDGSSGNVLWDVSFDGGAKQFDQAKAVAVDADRNIIAAGRFEKPFGGTKGDFAVLKFSPSGALLWRRDIDGFNDNDQANAVAVDTAGNAIAGGWILNPTTEADFAVMKLNGAEPLCPLSSPSGDSDGDGLPDCWENDGIDVDGDGVIDLELYDVNGDGSIGADERADPNQKDIYVEVDWMDQHQPSAGALQDVIDAFASAPEPIRLHLQHDESLAHEDQIRFGPGFGVPFGDVKSFGTANERAGDFRALKAKRLAIRYALFAHELEEGALGIAELSGNDLAIALGGSEPTGVPPHGVGGRDVQAGVFMHEIGHNLGLRHGGGDAINCKPNYLSVMSYARVLNNVPILGLTLDFSREQLATLDENDLSEPAGIGGPGESFTYVGPPPGMPAFGDSPIDWNRSGDATETGVGADANKLTGVHSGCIGDGTVLEGHDDWSNLVYAFRNSGDLSEFTHENLPDETISVAFLTEISPDTDGDGIPNLTDNCVLLSNDQADGDADGIGDVCDLCPNAFDPDQGDKDGDGVGDGCDNCIDLANAVLGIDGVPARQAFQTTTGGQLDSDADGFGNACDADFDGIGSVVGGVDLAHLLSSFNKDRSANTCGSASDQPCAEFDLDNSGQFIGGSDLGRAFQLFNRAPGPKCDTCPLICEGPNC